MTLKRISFIHIAAVILSIILTINLLTTVPVHAESSVKAEDAYASTVIYPTTGSSSGYSTSKVTLTYNIPSAGIYRISYAYWVEGAYSNGKLTFKHNNYGSSSVVTFYNSPNGNSTYISLPYSGTYTVTLEKYNSGSSTFYYALDIIK